MRLVQRRQRITPSGALMPPNMKDSLQESTENLVHKMLMPHVVLNCILDRIASSHHDRRG